MRYLIDTDKQLLEIEGKSLPLFSKESFEILSSLWLKVGWNERYHYTFTWLGQPVLQLPEDLIRLQEVLWNLQPDLIIESGVALGGSLLFHASFCKLRGFGHVLGIEVDLHKSNRVALENHPLAPWLSLVEGDSTDKGVFENVRLKAKECAKVVVFLDSNHSKAHVLKELELYSELVTKESYLIVADGFKKELTHVPRGKKTWDWDNPSCAVHEFLATHPEFILESPKRRYDRSGLSENVTHFVDAWLKRIL